MMDMNLCVPRFVVMYADYKEYFINKCCIIW